jgi:hypothetical protein
VKELAIVSGSQGLESIQDDKVVGSNENQSAAMGHSWIVVVLDIQEVIIFRGVPAVYYSLAYPLVFSINDYSIVCQGRDEEGPQPMLIREGPARVDDEVGTVTIELEGEDIVMNVSRSVG